MNKMNKILVGLLLILSVTSYSQDMDFKVSKYDYLIGNNPLIDSAINSFEYRFPENIYRVYCDVSTNTLTLQTRGKKNNGKFLNDKGYLIIYDLKDDEILHKQKINYTETRIPSYNDFLIKTVNDNESSDNNLVPTFWQIYRDDILFDPRKKITVSYIRPINPLNSEILNVIDITKHKTIYNKELTSPSGVNYANYINDSILLIVSSGLHLVNIQNGESWYYEARTGKNYPNGSYSYFYGSDPIKDLASNIIIDSTYYYFSSEDQIIKINSSNGNSIWSYSLPLGVSSKSALIKKKDIIYHINLGYVNYGKTKMKYGRPTVGAYSSNNGKQLFLTDINSNYPVEGIQILDNNLLLTFKRSIMLLSSENGTIINNIDFPYKEYGELSYIMGDKIYAKNDKGEFYRLYNSNKKEVFVLTNRNKVVSIDSQLNLHNVIESNDLFFNYLNTDKFKFLSNGTKTWILDMSDNIIATLPATPNACINERKLYDYHDHSFIIINLSNNFNAH